MVFSVVIHQEEGGFVGRCRELPEVVGMGETLDECCTNVREAFIAYFQEHGAEAIEASERKEEVAAPNNGICFSLN